MLDFRAFSLAYILHAPHFDDAKIHIFLETKKKNYVFGAQLKKKMYFCIVETR